MCSSSVLVDDNLLKAERSEISGMSRDRKRDNQLSLWLLKETVMTSSNCYCCCNDICRHASEPLSTLKLSQIFFSKLPPHPFLSPFSFSFQEPCWFQRTEPIPGNVHGSKCSFFSEEEKSEPGQLLPLSFRLMFVREGPICKTKML